MDDDKLEGRLAAIEIVLFALLQQLKADKFVKDLAEQKEIAVTALSNTRTPRKKIQLLEKRIQVFVDALELTE